MKNSDDYNENQLVEQLKKGDSDAFNKLFAIYGPRLFAFTNGYLKSKQEAEEIVQEVFTKLWYKRKDLKTGLSFKSYLFKIAYHLILEAFNRINKREAYKHKMLQQSLPVSNNIDERLDYQMLLKRVDALIEQLPVRQREILILKKKEGFAVKEIAKKLNISPKTVENHITEAMKKIRKKIKPGDLALLLFFLLFFSI